MLKEIKTVRGVLQTPQYVLILILMEHAQRDTKWRQVWL